jgi:hypothetical protein
MLQRIPDLRPALANADPAELADICDAFQVTAAYDKAHKTVELSATITPELHPKDKTPTGTDDKVGVFVYSGDGIETPTRDHPRHALRIEEWWSLRGERSTAHRSA